MLADFMISERSSHINDLSTTPLRKSEERMAGKQVILEDTGRESLLHLKPRCTPPMFRDCPLRDRIEKLEWCLEVLLFSPNRMQRSWGAELWNAIFNNQNRVSEYEKTRDEALAALNDEKEDAS